MTVIPTREQTPQIIRATAGPARRGPASPARPEAGLTGRDVFRILRKRKWLILIMLILCVGASVGATLLWLQFAPLYTAVAVLETRPEFATALRVERGVVPTDWMDSLAAKVVNVAQSDSVLAAAISDDRVRKTQWYRLSTPEDAMDRLKEDLMVRPLPGSSGQVAVSLTGTNAKELPEIVNAVVEAAAESSREFATSETRARIARLVDMQETLAKQRDSIREEKARLLRDADVPDMLERTNVLTMRLHSLAAQVEAAEAQNAQANAMVDLVKKQIQSGQVASLPAVLQSLDLDPALRSLRTTLMNFRSQRENLKRRFGDRHRTMRAFEDRVKALEGEVTSREKTLLDGQVAAMMANAEARKAIILKDLTQRREQYRYVDVSVRGLRATYASYNELSDRENDLKENLEQIGGRLVDLQIVASGSRPLQVRHPAGTPREPSMPQWKFMLPVGFLVGLILGFGLAFGLELIPTSIRGPSDIARRVDLPMLGMVPHEDDLEEEIGELRMAFSAHPNSLLSEAFRRIRTCLRFSGPASQRRSLLITSPLPEDGRTTVALNLAASIARGGRKVLVVDANFRQPAIHRLFPDCPQAGLSSALVGQADWRQLVSEVEPNYSVIAAGPLPPNPSELLGSEQMGTIIAEMVSEYDQVLFDGAPCLLVTDASTLSTLVDGVVLVVRAGANTFGIVQRTREMLSHIGAHVVGVVLNGARAMAGGYLRKNYDAFYEYQEQDKAQLPET